MKTFLHCFISVCFFFVGSAHAVEAQPDASSDDAPAPEAVVARLETTLIENMKAGDSMGYQGRFETLRPLLNEIMATDRMARYIFGRDWSSFDPAEQDAFRKAFLDLSAATYASQFKKFGGERFDPVAVQEQREDRVVVQRLLTTGSGKQISFDYLMTLEDSHWQIVTIITDGVSDLAIKRTQYRRILETRDFDAVIEYIRESTESQRSG